MRNTADMTGGKPIAVRSQSISGVVSSLAFYDIPGKKGEVFFYYYVPDTTRHLYTTQNCNRMNANFKIPSLLYNEINKEGRSSMAPRSEHRS
jgi:hypothetical protein